MTNKSTIEQLNNSLKEQLDKGDKPAFPNNSDLSILNSFKESRENELSKLESPSTLMWEKIEAQTKVKKTQKTSTSSQSWGFMRIAAIISAIALISLIYVNQMDPFTSNSSELLSSTASEYEQVNIQDEALIELRSFSTLEQVTDTDDKFAVRLQGEAYFEVKKRKDRIFEVQTDFGAIQVLGTAFNIKTDRKRTVVYLKEGSIQILYANNKKNILLRPKERMEITENGTKLTIIENDAQEIAWRNKELIFESRSLTSIIEELEQHYGIRIDYPDSIANESIRGVLKLHTIDSTLMHLGALFNGKFIKVDDGNYLLESRE